MLTKEDIARLPVDCQRAYLFGITTRLYSVEECNKLSWQAQQYYTLGEQHRPIYRKNGYSIPEK